MANSNNYNIGPGFKKAEVAVRTVRNPQVKKQFQGNVVRELRSGPEPHCSRG